MTGHKTYSDYSVTTDLLPELVDVLREYEDVFNDHAAPDIQHAWTLDKPVARGEILPAATHDRVAALLDQLAEYFHYVFDGYLLYVSRFPHLPQLAADAPDGVEGVLLGYPPADVAEWCARRDVSITDMADGAASERSVDQTSLASRRDGVRTDLIADGLCSPDEFADYSPATAADD